MLLNIQFPRITTRSARIRDCFPILRMDIRKVFGANARRFRLALGLSQEAVAERMGVDRAFVSSMERGLQNATLLTVWQIAQALEVRPADLLEERMSKVRS